jgi:hypothetical protein
MARSQHKKTGSVEAESNSRLIDLVSQDCKQAERVELEKKLRLVEQSLHDWLRQKIAEIDQSASSDRATPL